MCRYRCAAISNPSQSLRCEINKPCAPFTELLLRGIRHAPAVLPHLFLVSLIMYRLSTASLVESRAELNPCGEAYFDGVVAPGRRSFGDSSSPIICFRYGSTACPVCCLGVATAAFVFVYAADVTVRITSWWKPFGVQRRCYMNAKA